MWKVTVNISESASKAHIYLINMLYLIFSSPLFSFPLAIYFLKTLDLLSSNISFILPPRCRLTCSSTTYTSCIPGRPKHFIRFQVYLFCFFFWKKIFIQNIMCFLLHHFEKCITLLFLFLWCEGLHLGSDDVSQM